MGTGTASVAAEATAAPPPNPLAKPTPNGSATAAGDVEVSVDEVTVPGAGSAGTPPGVTLGGAMVSVGVAAAAVVAGEI